MVDGGVYTRRDPAEIRRRRKAVRELLAKPEPRELALDDLRVRSCRWCGAATYAGFGPCSCPQAMAEHARVMGSDQ